jgi:hypothetical protein
VFILLIPLSRIHVGGFTWTVAYIDEFKQESMMLASLRHPNVIDFYGVAFDPSTSYLYLGIATYFPFSTVLRKISYPVVFACFQTTN